MRIQHNIMAMNAYRNYNTNTKALSGNLEKLSSGYKINRAGDDAAGLAISEKMRAQITGLDAAQKNVKDGISLVKTAEGAMQEIQDMLNRMDYLATQSANGTYDDPVDRYNLQKEVDQLKTEINRIADSANFNGIKLLDGSLDSNATSATVTGKDRIISTVAADTDVPAVVTGTKTILDGAEPTKAQNTVFEMDFSDLKAVGDAGAGTGAGTAAKCEVAVTYGATPTWADGDTVQIAAAGVAGGGGLSFTATAILAVDAGTGAETWTVTGAPTGYSGEFDGTKLTLTADDVGEKSLAAADLGTITVTPTNAADNTLTATGAADFTDGTAAGAAGGAGAGGGGAAAGAITVSVKLNNTDIATGVSVDANDDAEAIAAAVMKKLNNDADVADGKIENLDLFADGTKYTAEITGSKIKFTLEDDPTADNIKGNFDWDVSITGGKFAGNHTAGTNVITPGSVEDPGARANTVFKLTTDDLKDGTVITLDGKSVTLSVGPDSAVKAGDGVVKLTTAEAKDIDLALGKISEGFGGGTTNFEVSVNNTKNGDTHAGLAVYKKASSKNSYTAKEDLEKVFSVSVPGQGEGKALTLQIGDTSDDFNQMKVSVGDMHTGAMGKGKLNEGTPDEKVIEKSIAEIDIGTQEGAKEAIDVIKNAINYVSSVRGDLGAIQNRLEHTGNNLSVMAENIQDAESTIRDTDVANEMMSYVKNNILVQSAQAMLAQANQVPQGVLQLLG